MKIEKDKILNKWLVWETHENYSVEVFRSSTKKQCKEWCEKHGK